MALSNQAEHRKRCDRCPVAQKKGDRATPPGQLLTKKVYERLKKRPAEPPQLGYPLNAAMEALYSNTKPPPTRCTANGRPGCALCLTKHSRNCTCGTELFDDHNPVKLDNFHCYVRGQNAPILCIDEPADQDEFKALLAQLFRGCRAQWEAARRMAVFAGIGAVSGLPSVLETLLPHIAAGNDGGIVKGVHEICRKALMLTIVTARRPPPSDFCNVRMASRCERLVTADGKITRTACRVPLANGHKSNTASTIFGSMLT